jgi:prolyl oligopeptidase
MPAIPHPDAVSARDEPAPSHLAPRLDLLEQLPAGDPRHQVADPYRWLEDPDDERTRAWSSAQDEVLRQHRDTWSTRAHFADRIGDLLGAGYQGPPIWRGRRMFSSRRLPGAEHGQVLVTDGANEPRVLIDPMAIDPSGNTTLDAYQPDKEGARVAYQLSVGGDENSVLRVLDVGTGDPIEPGIDRTRYSPVAWLRGGDAFYYVRRLAPELVPADEQQYHRRVYLHRLGTDPSDDVEIFGAGRPITSYYGVQVSWDGRWLVVSAAQGTDPRNDVWLADLHHGPVEAPQLTPVVVGADARTGAAVGRDGRLYVLTDLDAPRRRLAVADPARPGPAHWNDVVGERPDAVLEDFLLLDGPQLTRPQLLVSWTRHAVSEVSVHDTDGRQLAEISLPGLGSVGGLVGRPEGGSEAWFSYTDHVTVPHVLRYDATRYDQQTVAGARGVSSGPPSGECRSGGEYGSGGVGDDGVSGSDGVGDVGVSGSGGVGDDGVAGSGGASGSGGAALATVDVYSTPPGAVSVPDVASRLVAFTSADGEQVRMFVISPRDRVDDRGRPVTAGPAILYGYGGFSASMTPGYSAGILAWVEAGGVYAVACLRGGGEEGEEWHRAGMLERKQNVFDDFLAAAEHLIDQGWTTSASLGISGGSNGGLLVGAAMTQRPDLFAAVVCSAPLLDMVRYQQFGLGVSWTGEYGDAEDPEQLGWLLSYSPYHRVVEGTDYPATLFTVFDADSRVDPLHARKMAAALQHATASRRPVLLRREAEVGHGARALSKSVDLAADTFAFLARHTGLQPTGQRASSGQNPPETRSEPGPAHGAP